MHGGDFKNLVDMHQRSVKDFAQRELFGQRRGEQWVWMTYAEFGAEVEALRGGLKALGFEKGDRLGIISNNRPEWAAAAYATYGLSGAIVPMYEAQADKEWKYILNDSGARFVVVATEAIAKKILEIKPGIPTLEHVICLAETSATKTYSAVVASGKITPASADQPGLEDIADLLYTSGTTGNPKGVILTHGNIISNVNAIHEVVPMGREDRSLSFLPWAHAFGQTGELHVLSSLGAGMAIVDQVDKIIQYLAEVKPTVLVSVPRIFNRIYQGLQTRMNEEGGLKKTLFYAGMANANKRRALADRGKTSALVELKHKLFDKVVFSKVRDRFGGRLRYAVSGAAAISREVAEFIDNLGITVFEGYGLTETSPVATVNQPNARRIGSVGKPLRDVRIVIDKEASGDPVHGEIIIYGPNVMKGYYKLDEETKAVFTDDGGFRTGDLGYVDAEQFLFITGRIKEQYKLENGKYVAPAPLEEQLKLSPYLLNVMIYGDNKLYNTALVVPNVEAIRKWAQEQGKTLPIEQDALLKDAQVNALLAAELEKYSGAFKAFEKIKKFALISEDFTTQNGMLTPKMSLKRRVVTERYKSTLDGLY